MESQQIKKINDVAASMLASGKLNSKLYDEIENFIIRNGSTLANDKDFKRLRSTMSEVSNRFGLPDVTNIQENFGLNSCAQ